MFTNSSTVVICAIGLLHVLFMLGELFPWESPFIMDVVLKKWPAPLDLSTNERHFVAMVVHNAGIYNGIVALGLFVAASLGPGARPAQLALLAGGVVAGAFGAATLTRATMAQALIGVAGMTWVLYVG